MAGPGLTMELSRAWSCHSRHLPSAASLLIWEEKAGDRSDGTKSQGSLWAPFPPPRPKLN